jgi:hypothetical protein
MNLKYISVSMANCYFAEPHGMKYCYIPFFMLLISNALLVLARHSLRWAGKAGTGFTLPGHQQAAAETPNGKSGEILEFRKVG